MYNITNITGSGNESGILDFFVGVNTELMGGFLGDILLIGIAVILFISFYSSTNDIPKTLIGTFMICFILSISLAALGLVHTAAPFYCLCLLIAGIVMSYFNSQ